MIIRFKRSFVLIPLSSVAILAGGLVYGNHRLGSLDATLQFLQGERILVDHPVQDVGQVPDNTSKQLVYRVTNLTSTPVRILGLHSSCSCLTPGEPPEVIGAGESVLIPVKIHVSRLVPVFDVGLAIFTSDPATPVLRVEVTGTVAVGVPSKSLSASGRSRGYDLPRAVIAVPHSV